MPDSIHKETGNCGRFVCFNRSSSLGCPLNLQVFEDILKSSAKVAKASCASFIEWLPGKLTRWLILQAFTQAGVKRKYDLCLTAANVDHSPDGMPVAAWLQSVWGVYCFINLFFGVFRGSAGSVCADSGPVYICKSAHTEVDHLFTTISKLAPALQIGRNYGDKEGIHFWY